MIKKIAVEQLQAGMFVHDFNHDWKDPCCQEHDPNGFRGSRLIHSDEDVQHIIKHGINTLYIDSSRGKDVEDAQTAQEVMAALEAQMHALADDDGEFSPLKVISFEEEIKQAFAAKARARQIVGNVLEDCRMGKQVVLAPVRDAVEQMAESLFRNPDAILSLSLIKKKDEYTFMHSVNVGVFLMSFCRAMEMDADKIISIGIGGMLHDVGKMRTPDAILNKKGKLTPEEFEVIKQHVIHSKKILEDTSGIDDISLKVAAQHHERFDGSGYPLGLKGDGIDFYGQMGAIVDVYDAITTDRCYHKANSPHFALKRMLDWSKHHFSQELYQKFVHCIGIYPIGTLVRLKNGLLAVVIRPNKESLLHPVVRGIINSKTKKKIPPTELDLMSYKDKHQGGFTIVGSEPAEKWGVNPARFLIKPQLAN
ncbi:MAG: HD-GYP domain-containing protein [Magnetococcales bacterium]|nr:HD-GYP domain-containing protein [Magnetococcales bacterium]